jgi:hypothetical protein
MLCEVVMRSLALSILLLGVVANGAVADPVVDLSWNGCAGPIDRAVAAGDKPELYASVLGQSQTSIGYTIKLRLSTPSVYPDAWRFDPSGCEPFGTFQAGQDAPPPVAVSCPPLHGSVPSSLGKTFSYDGVNDAAAIEISVGYPGNLGQGNPGATNPSQRYHLAVVRFDMTKGVTGPSSPAGFCGGLEKPMCITVTSAQWGDPAGVLHSWTLGNSSLTANDPQNSSHCPGIGPTAAQRSTWGSIKSQYRL